MLATIVIGTAYSLVQLVASICNAISGGEGMLVLAFFGDKVHTLRYLTVLIKQYLVIHSLLSVYVNKRERKR